MRRWIITLLLVNGCAFSAQAAAPEVLILCYHSIEANNRDRQVGVATARLVEQFNWLQQNGYHPVSIDQLLAAKAGQKKLPAHPVLLTFDDGYASFQTNVLPLLQSFRYPAVLSVVGKWIEQGNGTQPASAFLQWNQLHALQQTGLVEIASHSYNQHHGILANPQGNTEPAFVTRRYDPATKRYESNTAYEKRLRDDMRAMRALFVTHMGKAPRVMVWPYGEYNGRAQALAKEYGMPITLGLGDRMARLDNPARLSRFLVAGDPPLGSFIARIDRLAQQSTTRSLTVDLDTIYDADPATQEKHLDALIDHVYREAINTVYLTVSSRPGEDEPSLAYYFPNAYGPMRADLLNRVAWQLRTRARAQTYVVLPKEALPNTVEKRKQLYAALASSAPIAGIQLADDEGDESLIHELEEYRLLTPAPKHIP